MGYVCILAIDGYCDLANEKHHTHTIAHLAAWERCNLPALGHASLRWIYYYAPAQHAITGSEDLQYMI